MVISGYVHSDEQLGLEQRILIIRYCFNISDHRMVAREQNSLIETVLVTVHEIRPC